MKPSILVVGLPLLLGGCASTLPPDVIACANAGQSLDVRPIHYRSSISGYLDRKPVDPKPWRKQNDAQSSSEGDGS
jgi:hypothetical protein